MTRAQLTVARSAALLGTAYKVEVAGLLTRIDALRDEFAEWATLSFPHGFDRIAAGTRIDVDRLRAVCDAEQTERVELLARDHARSIGVEIETMPSKVPAFTLRAQVSGTRALEADLAQLAAFGVQPPVCDAVREAVSALGAELLVSITDQVAADGARTWELRVAQTNHTDQLRAATSARIDRLAASAGVTAAQRRVAGGLHASLAREQLTHAWIRLGQRTIAPAVGLVWDRVEWQPIQRMLAGFHPAGDPVARIARLARATDVEVATVELVLGPNDPPAMRIVVSVGAT
jgi:hypothetical protein